MKHNDYFPQLFQRDPQNPILTIGNWPYPANSVFNCGAALFGGETILLVRVEDRRGMSHLTAAKSKDGRTGWQVDSRPTFPPDPQDYPEEVWGVEDPRITYIEELGEYFIVYTAYSEGGPLVSLVKTKDFVTFERLGPVMPSEDKNAALFPVRFDGRWAMLHRPVSPISRTGVHIWISFSPDLKHWGDHRILLWARRGGWWDADKIGISPPPLRLPEGWLILYHGVRTTGGGVIYRLGLALLDLENPTKVLRRSDEWVFGPQERYERDGDVDDVVFPCGWVKENDLVRLYYGAADTSVALATASIDDLREYINRCPEVLR